MVYCVVLCSALLLSVGESLAHSVFLLSRVDSVAMWCNYNSETFSFISPSHDRDLFLERVRFCNHYCIEQMKVVFCVCYIISVLEMRAYIS